MAVSNSIGLIQKYSKEYFDKVYKQEAVTSVLDASPALVKFEGAKTVKIAKLQTGGLSDYYRNNDQIVHSESGANFVGAGGFGYQASSARLIWQEFTLRMDRGAMFQIEYFDNEESGDLLVGNMTTEISRTVMIPEIDAYCLSELAKNAGTSTVAQASDKPVAALNAAFQTLAENEVPSDDQLVFISPEFATKLRSTDEVSRPLLQSDLVRGKEVKFEITNYEGRDLIVVSPNRLRSDFVSNPNGGFHWGANSQKINFMVVAKSACMHVVKYEKVKILEGDIVLAMGYDGYAIAARVYHDLFVLDNKKVGIYVNYAAGSAAVDYQGKLTITQDTAHKVTSAVVSPADLLYTRLVTSSSNVVTNGKLGGTLTDVKLNETVLTTAQKVYAVNADNIVIAMATGVTYGG